MKYETDLMKEMRTLKREMSLVLRKQDLVLRALIPGAEPSASELRIIRKRKHFSSERELLNALR